MPIPDEQLRAAFKASGAFLLKRRPPPKIRDQLDYKVDIEGQEVVLLEIRPRWDDKTQIRETPVAKIKWVGSKRVWRLFWMRADLKWYSYEPRAEAPTIDALFDEVASDPHGCFFG